MKTPRGLRTALLVSGVVGSAVSLGHAQWPDAQGWVIAHAALPACVFSGSAWISGHRRLTRALVLRGLATVAVVAAGFTLANDVLGLSRWAKVAANYLIPLCVSLVGSTSGARERMHSSSTGTPGASGERRSSREAQR
ncbi:MAG TPA: hypothetical protein VFU02_20270 [Polyangiaceae bacterium]|nr:hypothetical protein [Polyangiaceae bacterium]